MAVDLRVLFYETPEGECPLREFIDSWKIREQAKKYRAGFLSLFGESELEAIYDDI